MICYRTNRYLHDAPECLIVKKLCNTVRTTYPGGKLKFRTQYNTKTGPQTDDVWRILWRQREREAAATVPPAVRASHIVTSSKYA